MRSFIRLDSNAVHGQYKFIFVFTPVIANFLSLAKQLVRKGGGDTLEMTS
jgi:hypothetical protein